MVFVTSPGAADPEVAQRMLQNLGYASSFGFAASLLAFQSDQEIEETGELDDATSARLDEVYAELAEL